jgi:ketosteroid isomerase-like protein
MTHDERSLAVAESFYDAMHRLDVSGILDVLAPDFVGHVSEGLPGGFGGRHDGAQAMVDDVWVPVYRAFRALPHPAEYLAAGPGRVLVLGEYRGEEPEPFTAEFAHVLRVTDGRIAELRQITDTRRWPPVER